MSRKHAHRGQKKNVYVTRLLRATEGHSTQLRVPSQHRNLHTHSAAFGALIVFSDCIVGGRQNRNQDDILCNILGPLWLLGSERKRSLNSAYATQAGGCAGMCVDLTLFPLDTMKTRLQSQQGFYRAGGFRGIYAGVPSAALGSFPSGKTTSTVLFC